MTPPTPYLVELSPVTTAQRARPIWCQMSIGVPGGGAGCCGGISGDQCAGFTYWEPMPMKAITTVSLMNTTMLLTVADSDTPTTSSEVTARMATMAGRFITPVAITAPAASLTGTPGAAVSAGGMTMCMSRRRLAKYPDQPTATVEAARPYSKRSSRPMIQATTSPMEA